MSSENGKNITLPPWDSCDAVELAKRNYISNLGKKLNNPNCTSKISWKIIHRLLNKCKIPKIPPILNNGTFILDC